MLTVSEILKVLIKKLNEVKFISNEELPLDYNFSINHTGVYFLLKPILDLDYKDVIPFEIHIRGKSEYYGDMLTDLANYSSLVDHWWSDDFGNQYWLAFDNPRTLFPDDGTGIKHIILNLRLNANYSNE